MGKAAEKIAKATKKVATKVVAAFKAPDNAIRKPLGTPKEAPKTPAPTVQPTDPGAKNLADTGTHAGTIPVDVEIAKPTAAVVKPKPAINTGFIDKDSICPWALAKIENGIPRFVSCGQECRQRDKKRCPDTLFGYGN